MFIQLILNLNYNSSDKNIHFSLVTRSAGKVHLRLFRVLKQEKNYGGQ